METRNDIRANGLGNHLGYFLATGLLATVTMDLAALLMLMSGMVRLGPYRIVPNLLGRWVGSFRTGAMFHSTILETPALPHEKILGLFCHYAIGITLTSLFLYPYVQIWQRRVTLRSAIFYGIATCVFPYFIMFPAMGFGVMGFKLTVVVTLLSVSFLNHVAFGIGIFVWSNLLSKPLLSAQRSAH